MFAGTCRRVPPARPSSPHGFGPRPTSAHISGDASYEYLCGRTTDGPTMTLPAHCDELAPDGAARPDVIPVWGAITGPSAAELGRLLAAAITEAAHGIYL